MAFQLATFRHTNRILERRCFETTQRGQHLASDLGFEDVDEAETALSTNPHLYHRASIEYNATRVTELERDLRKQTELLKDDLHSTQELTQTVNRLCAENSRLRDEVERAKIGLFFHRSSCCVLTKPFCCKCINDRNRPPRRVSRV